MRTLLLTILGCLAFTAGHAGAAAQNPAPETAGAQQGRLVFVRVQLQKLPHLLEQGRKLVQCAGAAGG